MRCWSRRTKNRDKVFMPRSASGALAATRMQMQQGRNDLPLPGERGRVGASLLSYSTVSAGARPRTSLMDSLSTRTIFLTWADVVQKGGINATTFPMDRVKTPRCAIASHTRMPAC